MHSGTVSPAGQMRKVPDRDAAANGINRRVHPRHACNLLASCKSVDGKLDFLARVVNVSRGGIGIRAPQPVERGTIMTVEMPLALDRPAHRLLACVVHCGVRSDGAWGLGCAFAVGLDNADLRSFGIDVPKFGPDECCVKRYPCWIDAWYQPLGLGVNQPNRGIVTEISGGGIYIQTKQLIDPGSVLRLELPRNGRNDELKALGCVLNIERCGQEDWMWSCNFVRQISEQELSVLSALTANGHTGNGTETKQLWYFKQLGEKHGPLSTPEFMTLIARGDIGPETMILQRGQWVPACKVRGLFKQSAPKSTARPKPKTKPKSNTVRTMSANAAGPANQTPRLDPITERSTNRTHSRSDSTVAVNGLDPEPNWFFKELGPTQGPLATDDFMALLAKGAIAPDTLVLHRSMGRWVPARKLRESIQKHLSGGNRAAPATTTPTVKDVVAESDPAATASGENPRPNWYFKGVGPTQGPVSTVQFLSLVGQGEIGPETLVLHRSMSRWLPACKLRGLVKYLAEAAEKRSQVAMSRPKPNVAVATVQQAATLVEQAEPAATAAITELTAAPGAETVSIPAIETREATTVPVATESAVVAMEHAAAEPVADQQTDAHTKGSDSDVAPAEEASSMAEAATPVEAVAQPADDSAAAPEVESAGTEVEEQSEEMADAAPTDSTGSAETTTSTASVDDLLIETVTVTPAMAVETTVEATYSQEAESVSATVAPSTANDRMAAPVKEQAPTDNVDQPEAESLSSTNDGVAVAAGTEELDEPALAVVETATAAVPEPAVTEEAGDGFDQPESNAVVDTSESLVQPVDEAAGANEAAQPEHEAIAVASDSSTEPAAEAPHTNEANTLEYAAVCGWAQTDGYTETALPPAVETKEENTKPEEFAREVTGAEQSAHAVSAEVASTADVDGHESELPVNETSVVATTSEMFSADPVDQAEPNVISTVTEDTPATPYEYAPTGACAQTDVGAPATMSPAAAAAEEGPEPPEFASDVTAVEDAPVAVWSVAESATASERVSSDPVEPPEPAAFPSTGSELPVPPAEAGSTHQEDAPELQATADATNATTTVQEAPTSDLIDQPTVMTLAKAEADRAIAEPASETASPPPALTKRQLAARKAAETRKRRRAEALALNAPVSTAATAAFTTEAQESTKETGCPEQTDCVESIAVGAANTPVTAPTMETPPAAPVLTKRQEAARKAAATRKLRRLTGATNKPTTSVAETPTNNQATGQDVPAAAKATRPVTETPAAMRSAPPALATITKRQDAARKAAATRKLRQLVANRRPHKAR